MDLIGRIFNLYTLRALAVLALTLCSAYLPEPVVAELERLVDLAGAGDAQGAVLVLAGLAYVLLDLWRKGRQIDTAHYLPDQWRLP